MQIFCNRPDGRVALPVFVCTIGQIHVHRNCPVRQSILINFSCKFQVLHTSCPRNFSSFWRFFFQFFIFFRNCFFHLRILDLHFTHQCFLAHVGDSSCTPVLQNIRFFKVDAPLKVQLQRRIMGCVPVFMTINCPFGIDFSSSTVRSGLPIIWSDWDFSLP